MTDTRQSLKDIRKELTWRWYVSVLAMSVPCILLGCWVVHTGKGPWWAFIFFAFDGVFSGVSVGNLVEAIHILKTSNVPDDH